MLVNGINMHRITIAREELPHVKSKHYKDFVKIPLDPSLSGLVRVIKDGSVEDYKD